MNEKFRCKICVHGAVGVAVPVSERPLMIMVQGLIVETVALTVVPLPFGMDTLV